MGSGRKLAIKFRGDSQDARSLTFDYWVSLGRGFTGNFPPYSIFAGRRGVSGKALSPREQERVLGQDNRGGGRPALLLADREEPQAVGRALNLHSRSR